MVGTAAGLAEAVDPTHPTIDTLRPEADMTIANHCEADEWAQLSASELECVSSIRQRLGATAFAALPLDTLVTYIRGYSYRTDWHDVAYVYLKQHLVWRSEVGIDAVLSTGDLGGIARFLGPRLGARLAEFDAMFPSGVVGRDAEGHLVTVERMIPNGGVRASIAAFTDDEFVTMMLARREMLRAVIAANAASNGRRTYKLVSIIDMSGLRLVDVTDRRWHARMAKLFDFLGWHYPASGRRIVVINAPRIFTGLWQIFKVFLHPIVVKRVCVVGTYSRTLHEIGFVPFDGVQLDEHGKLPSQLRTWSEVFAPLVTSTPARTLAELTRGFVPHADLVALHGLREGATVQQLRETAAQPAASSDKLTEALSSVSSETHTDSDSESAPSQATALQDAPMVLQQATALPDTPTALHHVARDPSDCEQAAHDGRQRETAVSATPPRTAAAAPRGPALEPREPAPERSGPAPERSGPAPEHVRGWRLAELYEAGCEAGHELYEAGHELYEAAPISSSLRRIGDSLFSDESGALETSMRKLTDLTAFGDLSVLGEEGRPSGLVAAAMTNPRLNGHVVHARPSSQQKPSTLPDDELLSRQSPPTPQLPQLLPPPRIQQEPAGAVERSMRRAWDGLFYGDKVRVVYSRPSRGRRGSAVVANAVTKAPPELPQCVGSAASSRATSPCSASSISSFAGGEVHGEMGVMGASPGASSGSSNDELFVWL
jgi:hypothetical protein